MTTTTKPTALQQVIRVTHSIVIQCICLSLNILFVFSMTQGIYGFLRRKNDQPPVLFTAITASLGSLVINGLLGTPAFLMAAFVEEEVMKNRPGFSCALALSFNVSFALVYTLLWGVFFVAEQDGSADIVQWIVYGIAIIPLLYAVGYVTVKTMPKEQ